MKMKHKILSIDDDTNFLKSIKKLLEFDNYLVTTISNSSNVIDFLQEESFDLILLDVKMPGINGVDLFNMIVNKIPSVPIIMVSGQSNIEIAVELIKNGAFDFIEKPLDPDRLLVTIKNALKKHELIYEKENLFKELEENFRMIGESKSIFNLINKIKSVAPTNAKILIEGDSGTGKELVAWAVHHNSDRSGKPYIKLNCAAIPSELLESELFGHKKGSFTGADKDREGKFVAANGGSLFLDEIGDMSISLQAKLLRVLEEDEIEVIGENIPRQVDVRIIAATNKNLLELVAKGEFREDLYHRLNVIKLMIEPLSNRKDDIMPLAYHFLNSFSSNYNKQVTNISTQAEAALLHYDYPGNVRELRNLIEKLVIFSASGEIGLNDIYNVLSKDKVKTHYLPEDITNLKEVKKEFEKEFITKILEDNDWKIQETASLLGIDRTNLFKKMKFLGITKI